MHRVGFAVGRLNDLLRRRCSWWTESRWRAAERLAARLYDRMC